MTVDLSAEPDYRIEVTVGGHAYSATYPTTPSAPDTVALPLTVGWRIRESEFWPAQADLATGSFTIVCDTIAEVNDLAIGDPVRINVYTPATSLDPWQKIGGVVTQLDAEVGARAGDRSFVRVYFTDHLWLLSQIVVGLDDWPQEYVYDRLARICNEAQPIVGLDTGLTDQGLLGILPARSASPTDMLSAVQQTLKDDMARSTGYSPYVFYGPDVLAYDPDVRILHVVTFQKRPYSWPAELGSDGTLHYRPGVQGALYGNTVAASGRWSRLPADRPTYVIVDGTTFGDPDQANSVPLVRNTAYVDDFTLPGGNTSADARVNLGRALLPTGDGQVPGWRTDTVRHYSYLDPEPVAGWIDGDAYVVDLYGLGWARIRPTIIEPIDPSLTLDGKTWIAGMLTAATLTIPPGGKFYLDVTLRPEILPPFVPLSSGAATYDDVPPALTYADVNPLLTYRDANLIGD